mmetsp:Transcript_7680/g.31769  ORF Transcript_7680/g.31769 Transcript_7680/m.31769 type:complete len:227 (+) Transcript_7680:2081-2761(+)
MQRRLAALALGERRRRAERQHDAQRVQVARARAGPVPLDANHERRAPAVVRHVDEGHAAAAASRVAIAIDDDGKPPGGVLVDFVAREQVRQHDVLAVSTREVRGVGAFDTFMRRRAARLSQRDDGRDMALPHRPLERVLVEDAAAHVRVGAAFLEQHVDDGAAVVDGGPLQHRAPLVVAVIWPKKPRVEELLELRDAAVLRRRPRARRRGDLLRLGFLRRLLGWVR